jgi:hypothetical protein
MKTDRPTPAALTPALQADIRARYQSLRENIGGFIQRPAQRYLIAAIARALAEHGGVLVAEAPTGTGKSRRCRWLCQWNASWWSRPPPSHCRSSYWIATFRHFSLRLGSKHAPF